MGLTVKCRKTGDEFDLGYFGFARLRQTVSEIVGDPWKSHYELLSHHVGWEESDYDDWDKKAEEMYAAGQVSEAVLEFTMTSDAEGHLKWQHCRDLLKLIGDYDDNVIYGYAGRPNPAKFADFVRVLKACATNRVAMYWV